ncbi:MAG: phosphatase PAP2 family protein [Bacteroidetes bacterium]|nr:phosphatase PAP2 family protein [Bacteroidota bacterium]
MIAKFPGFLIKLSLLACLFLTSVSTNAQLSKLDRATLEEISEDRKAKSTEFYKFISNSTNYISMGMPVSLFIAGVITEDKGLKKSALVAGESIVVSTLFTYALKNTVKRPRPYTVDSLIIKIGPGGGYSFPSGHTSEAFALATSLSMSYPKWYVIGPAYLWASTVAYSRMYLGVHYPTDILAGAIVGSGSAYLSHKLNHWINQKHEKKLSVAFAY